MKCIIAPHYDSDNSNPPDVEFEDGTHMFMVTLHGPERHLQFPYDEFLRVVKALCPKNKGDE